MLCWWQTFLVRLTCCALCTLGRATASVRTFNGSDQNSRSDDATFALSAVQEEISAGWRRPHELFECAEGPGHEDMVMDVSGHACLMQDITTDCSVVASLCAAAHILTGRRLVRRPSSCVQWPRSH